MTAVLPLPDAAAARGPTGAATPPGEPGTVVPPPGPGEGGKEGGEATASPRRRVHGGGRWVMGKRDTPVPPVHRPGPPRG